MIGSMIVRVEQIPYPTEDGRRAKMCIFLRFPERSTRSTKHDDIQVCYGHRVEGNKAVGVKYTRHGKEHKAFAKKEVILSAGAIGSPRILMLSGIGPEEHLTSLGIPLIANLPVGKNLQDHLSAYLGPFCLEKKGKGRCLLFDRDATPGSFLEWFFGKGILTTTAVNAHALVVSPFAKKAGEGDWADLQIVLAGLAIYKNCAKDVARAFCLKEEILKKYFEGYVGLDCFFLLVSVGRTFSVGHLKLTSKDPESPLEIDPNYYGDSRDLQKCVEGLKLALDLVEKSKAFRDLGAEFTRNKLPECDFPPRSDAYWECYCKCFIASFHHIVGTCAIGSVVDNELKVKGIEGLRVADASVMPFTPVCNTAAATMMIGEKASHLIMNTYNKPTAEVPPDQAENTTP